MNRLAKSYRYVGPESIRNRTADQPKGAPITCIDDIRRWARERNRQISRETTVTAAFIVDEKGRLRIADRRSEHVACAGGDPVRSAGEITFNTSPDDIGVTWITNQSTGYCPEPESWPAVADALLEAGIEPPKGFHRAYSFRRCDACGEINIVKDAMFECAICSNALSPNWNCGGQ